MKTNGILLWSAAVTLGLVTACRSNDGPPASTGDKAAAPGAPVVTAAMLERGRTLYKANCVGCHGEGGKGDGPAAGVMKPPPRDHTDRAYMDTLTDKQIGEIIQMGGAMKGKPLMPSHPQLRGNDLDAIVAFVRSLSMSSQ